MQRTSEQMELHTRLVRASIARRDAILNPAQEITFNDACWRAMDENPLLNFDGLMIAASIYLNLILEFPDLSL